MLYVFQIVGTKWCKIGYTSCSNPWNRVRNGFWTNSHPPELCSLLGNLALLAAFEGDLQLETEIKQTFPPDHGEFWHLSKIVDILPYLRSKTKELEDIWETITPEATDKMPCCGGRSNICYRCHRQFARFHQLRQHILDMHRGVRAQCSKCGKQMIPRNLKRHMSSCMGVL